ncbi:MAG: acyl-CoA dehydrogenase family protein, partial [Thermoplasmata archaeon]
MDFKLNKEQETIRKVAREFAEKDISPISQELDEKGEFPPEHILKKMRELNLFGLTTPKEYGGAGIDTISYSLVIEEISKVCAGIGVILSVHNSVSTHPILTYGTKEQREKYLPRLASGKKIGAFALTESNAGSDAAAQETTAILRGNQYIINGTKIFITNGSKADVVLVMAMTDKSKGTRGISAFIVEKGTDGFTLGSKENKMGIRCSDTYELVFQDCKIPKENILGKEGEGFKIAMSTLDGGRIGIASQAVG